ncbi:MAG: hypothetical protein HQK50_06945 [Oligoflexia bacterium]|nr:hypothetical protein [Oligoflexia bacterium]
MKKLIYAFLLLTTLNVAAYATGGGDGSGSMPDHSPSTPDPIDVSPDNGNDGRTWDSGDVPICGGGSSNDSGGGYSGPDDSGGGWSGI